MESQEPENDQTNKNPAYIALKSAHRKRGKPTPSKSNTQAARKLLADSMAIWTENLMAAQDCQLKCQVAYWKAKAQDLKNKNLYLRKAICRYYKEHVLGNSNQNPQNTSDDIASESDIEEEDEEEEDYQVNEINEASNLTPEFRDFLVRNPGYRQIRRNARLRTLEAERNAREHASSFPGRIN